MNKACNRGSILLATEHIGSKDQTIGGGRVGVNIRIASYNNRKEMMHVWIMLHMFGSVKGMYQL